MEIAAIFLAYCTNYFLKAEGKLAFVLPRSFFSADHHDNTRSGKAKGMKLTSVWDLDKVTPLFRIPCGVLFAEKTKVTKKIPVSGIGGKVFTGRIQVHNCNWKEAQTKLKEENVVWFYTKQGQSSALSTRKVKTNNKTNIYKKLFKNGATLYPRAFFFIRLNQEMPPDFIDREVNIKTSELIQTDAKVPWKGLDFAGKVESHFLYMTALAKNILPFNLYDPAIIMLPLIIKGKENQKEINLLSGKELMKKGFLNASRWLQNAENIWDLKKTEKNKNVTLLDCINWQKKLSQQNLNAKYLVLYNSSAKDANATVVIRKELDLEFIVENTTYVLYTDEIKEAYYLTSILNSTAPNKMMKDFQAKGLFGARHVHKKILDIYYPKYDENNEIHKQLAALSQTAHTNAALYIENNPPQQELGAIHLGRLRVAIKKHLATEMGAIDKLVKKIIE